MWICVSVFVHSHTCVVSIHTHARAVTGARQGARGGAAAASLVAVAVGACVLSLGAGRHTMHATAAPLKMA